MKPWILIAALLAGPVLADDSRQLVQLPAAAETTLRAEMRDNLSALNEILSLMVAGKVKEAGVLAESAIGQGAMGRHRALPLEARPGPHMGPAMHDLGRQTHVAASEFAQAAASGDREQALSKLPRLTATCVACHLAYRIR